tara:strand:+ start:2285 stop:2863 length:579 start_codon:yes stop_codon:yes gene_type:complete
MVNNFVNLVSWRYFIKKSSKNRTLFIDSLSLYVSCRMFGYSVKKISGVNFFHNNINSENSIFLLSEEIKLFKNQITLPFWKSIDNIKLDNLLIQKLKGYDTIIIGISSPKQDYLGDLINDLYPKKNIFCLGAAIYTSSKDLKSDKFLLNWFIMLLKDFRRFRNKISITVKEFSLIIFNSESRANFRAFLNNL